MVGLLAEVARTYFDLRNAQRQLALTRRNLETQQQTYALIQTQQRGDMASDFDVQRAGARVAATAAILPALEAQRDAALNRLAVLAGTAPGGRDALLAGDPDLASLDRRLLVAAPAAVLAARPDVRAAERRFVASISASDAATAELFPTISLTALFGVQTSSLLSANPWSIGAGLVQPVLNFGLIRSRIDAADARQTQAFLGYQQTVLEALENMENALSGYLHEAGRNAALASAAERNRKATDLARRQYAAGFSGLLDLLVAERDLLDAEAGQAASDYALRKALVGIYAAAGGGWRETPG
jgi:multidrug efflux system outer membrane protein